MYLEELFFTAIEIEALGSGKPVSFVGIQYVLHRNVFLLHPEGNLVGFDLFHSRVIRSLANQKRSFDVIHVE